MAPVSDVGIVYTSVCNEVFLFPFLSLLIRKSKTTEYFPKWNYDIIVVFVSQYLTVIYMLW